MQGEGHRSAGIGDVRSWPSPTGPAECARDVLGMAGLSWQVDRQETRAATWELPGGDPGHVWVDGVGQRD